MSNPLPEELERLSLRGPHADCSVVIADAIALADSEPGRTTRRGGAVAAVLVLVVGLGALAYVRTDSSNTHDGLPAIDAATTPIATENIPVSTIRVQPTTCPEVDFAFDETAAAIGLTTARGTSDRSNAGFQLSEDLFMWRQGPFESEPDWVTSSDIQGRLDVTTRDGFETTVYPAALGSPGPRVAFVFPANASADDPCSSWSIGSQDPNRPPADLLTLIEGLEMIATDPASDPFALDPSSDTSSAVLAEGRYGGPLRDQGCDWKLIPVDNPPGVSVRTVTLGGQGSSNFSPEGVDDVVWVRDTVICTDGPTVAVGGVSRDVTRVVVRSPDGEEIVLKIFDVPGQPWRAVMGEYPSTWLTYVGESSEVIAFRDGEVLAREPYER